MGYKKVLLIDDDLEDQEIFLGAVSEIASDINCSAISDAAEALKLIESKSVSPEVIFLDLNMPVMNGQQFLVEIKKREQLRDIPVIIFSTSSHHNTVNLMKELGAHDFITKPNKFDKLVEILTPLFS